MDGFIYNLLLIPIIMKNSNWLLLIMTTNLISYFVNHNYIDDLIIRITLAIYASGYYILRQLEQNKPKK